MLAQPSESALKHGLRNEGGLRKGSRMRRGGWLCTLNPPKVLSNTASYIPSFQLLCLRIGHPQSRPDEKRTSAVRQGCRRKVVHEHGPRAGDGDGRGRGGLGRRRRQRRGRGRRRHRRRYNDGRCRCGPRRCRARLARGHLLPIALGAHARHRIPVKVAVLARAHARARRRSALLRTHAGGWRPRGL